MINRVYTVLRGGLRVIRRRLAFMLLCFGFGLVAMGVSFVTVRWLTSTMVDERLPDPKVQRRAILLRGFANDLTSACNDYARVVGNPDGGVTADAQNWIDRAFRRDIRFLEQRMRDNAMPSISTFLQLQSAVRRCASMARHPEDRTLMQSALRDGHRAIAGVNDYISEVNMTNLAGPPARRVEFD